MGGRGLSTFVFCPSSFLDLCNVYATMLIPIAHCILEGRYAMNAGDRDGMFVKLKDLKLRAI